MVKNKRILKQIDRIVGRIRDEYQPDKVILYGSYAYGKPHSDSDIDLFIVKRTDKEPIYRFAEVKRLIYDARRRIPVSPLVYTPDEVAERLAIGDQFIIDILEQGVVLYAR